MKSFFEKFLSNVLIIYLLHLILAIFTCGGWLIWLLIKFMRRKK